MKKLALLLLTMVLAVSAQAQSVTHVFHFGNPVMSEYDGYQQIGFENCLPKGQVGDPTLPWQNVSLILPQGEEALSINVELSDWVEMEGSYTLLPSQKPRPYSSDEVISFAKNEAVYRSSVPYPTKSFGSVSTQYLNGVAFAFGGFTPVQYIPATGKVSYARTATVSIETTASRDGHDGKLWLTPGNEASIKRLAQNPGLLGTYGKRGREIGGYDMLVITAESWISQFGEYLALYNGKGVRTHIVSLEEIYATMGGRDQQEQIRNYIIQEYENNGISMVTLGGDVAIVPFRYLYCWAQEGEEDQLPSDMYYACLDGTLNDDNDDRWGEVGEDDLLPELGIGRLPFNNEAQFETIMQKTFSYLQNPVLGEFTSPILGAEHLGDGYYGSDDMERLIGTCSDYDYTTHGYPTNYNFKKFYASPQMSWSGKNFRQLIGTGGQYVHHVGHANTGTVAGWEIGSLANNSFAGNNGIDHNYMLFHSHGCICGDFSHACILEKMVTLQTGFVATTGNSRYGWYVPWGDGMAAHIHREFVDAYCNDHIDILGMALREAKIATAPWVTMPWGDEGCLRWNIYCLNVIGDGALCPWFDEPFQPNVVFEKGLNNGITSTQVHVSHFDAPLDHFTVSLFDGETLLARGITNANGNAELVFSPALDVDGDMQLIVTGQNAWPQTFEVNHIANGEAFVYGDITGLDGEAIYGTQLLWVGGDLYNKGDVTANDVHAAITSDCEYILAHDSNFTIDAFEPNSTQHFDHVGQIDIANNIPDQTIFTLDLTAYVGEESHTTQKSFVAQAPNLQFTGIEIDDSMGDGNGFADPGEQVTLIINGMNYGHATSPEISISVTCDNSGLHFLNEDLVLDEVGPDGKFSANFGFYTDASMTNGTMIHLDITLQYGEYNTTMEHLLNIGILMETFESGDFSYTDWEHDGQAPWSVTDEVAHTGNYSARSGAIGDDEVSNLIIYADVLEESEIGFWFKTSSDYHKDYLVFYLDGNVKYFWSGETDWTYVSYDFPAGTHEFKWSYDKNHNGAAGADCAWIDDITFPRTCLITGVEETITKKQASVYPNPCQGSFTLELVGESDVVVSNLMGQTIIKLNKVMGQQQIQLGNAGIYLVQVYRSSGVETLKVVVE